MDDDACEKSRKQYLYFKHLRFLDHCKATGLNVKPDQEVSDEESMEDSPKTTRRPTFKHNTFVDTPIIETRSVAREDINEKSIPQDEDTMFMMSLIPELKKIPSQDRLRVKSQIMNVLLLGQSQSESMKNYVCDSCGYNNGQ